MRITRFKIKLLIIFLFSEILQKLLENKSFFVSIINVINKYAPVAQLDRVFGYEPKGRGFESLQA